MTGGAMLIAQISDLHIGFHADDPDEPNARRLDMVIDRLLTLDRAPDCVIASGDLTEHGDAASYARLRDQLARLKMPVHLMPGNHDDRAALLSAFPQTPVADGFLQQAIELPGLRLLLLDTLDPARHGGAFCEERAGWLRARLAEQPTKPTILFLHHPPVGIGIGWMDPDPAEPWIAHLAGAIGEHRQIVGIACGHVHRPTSLLWQGRPLIICPSSAPEVGLALLPVDPERPDGRALIADGEPGFALHLWTGERLITHFVGGAPAILAAFTRALQPMMREMVAEAAGAGAPSG